MVSIAQLVRASDCGSEGRGFDPHCSPPLVRDASNRGIPDTFLRLYGKDIAEKSHLYVISSNQSHKLKNIALIINTLEDMAYKSLILIICALMVPTMGAWAADEVAASRREAAVRHGHQH